MAVVWKLLMPHSVLLYPGDCVGGIQLTVLANLTVRNSEVVGNRQGPPRPLSQLIQRRNLLETRGLRSSDVVSLATDVAHRQTARGRRCGCAVGRVHGERRRI